MKILIFGGSGQLGKALQKLLPEGVYPTRGECDIIDPANVFECLHNYLPDVIIHAAAFTDNRKVENSRCRAVDVNIVGTANIVLGCEPKTRLVYISTDYVYPGDRGNYVETDPLQPFNLYAWTKLGGECAVRAIANHLIIRTSFGCEPFPYPEAFVDKWTSKDYVDRVAKQILDATLSPLTGVLNLGTERKTLYAYATARPNNGVRAVRMRDTSHHTPYDTSLNLQKWVDYLDNPVARPHTRCRACGFEEMEKYLDLGLMPLSNNLFFDSKSARQAERYPLQVLRCRQCGLSQLSVVADPKKMFSYYTYRSGINEGYRTHCQEMLMDLMERFPVYRHIDIAGNDGTLLKCGKMIMGKHHRDRQYVPINVDPAANLTAIAQADGIESVTEFWGDAVALRYGGSIDLITATNVFAHVDNIHEFLYACYAALDIKGILCLEFPYIIDFVDKKEFDTVYFEHLSYMSLHPITLVCAKVGLEVIEVSRQPIHGGTLRVIIAHVGSYAVDSGVAALLIQEGPYQGETIYQGWNQSVRKTVTQFREKLLELKQQGKKIAAFAASAKGNTLLNVAGVTTDLIDFIADETPEKVGKFSPGTGIPIVSKEEIIRQKPDSVVILSWNFAEDIILKLKDMGYEGSFIIPHQ